MSGHADTQEWLETIRYEHNVSRATAALDALLVENQRLRVALAEIELWPFDVNETDEADLRAVKDRAREALRSEQ